MITRIKLENYRSYREAEFPLKPLTALIGPVSGGKSNFFKALVFLKNTIFNEWKELFPPGPNEFRWVRNRSAKVTDPMGFELESDDLEDFPGERAKYILRLAESPQGIFVLQEELIRVSQNKPETWIFRRDMSGTRVNNIGDFTSYTHSILNEGRRYLLNPIKDGWMPALSHLSNELGMSRVPIIIQEKDYDLRFIRNVSESLPFLLYYHLEASSLKKPGEGQPVGQIGTLGQRLPDYLALLKSRNEYRFFYDSIIEDLSEILPNFKELIITQVEPDKQSIAMFFKGHNGPIAAPDLSDGTMFVLGILCIVHNPYHPKLICIEEPETGLHPKLMRWLLDKLIDLSYNDVKEKRVQVTISTHSPYLLDLFKDMQDSVLVIEQREGISIVTPLVEIQQKLGNGGDGAPLGYEWASGLFEGFF